MKTYTIQNAQKSGIKGTTLSALKSFEPILATNNEIIDGWFAIEGNPPTIFRKQFETPLAITFDDKQGTIRRGFATAAIHKQVTNRRGKLTWVTLIEIVTRIEEFQSETELSKAELTTKFQEVGFYYQKHSKLNRIDEFKKPSSTKLRKELIAKGLV